MVFDNKWSCDCVLVYGGFWFWKRAERWMKNWERGLKKCESSWMSVAGGWGWGGEWCNFSKFWCCTSCLRRSLPALPRMNGSSPAFSGQRCPFKMLKMHPIQPYLFKQSPWKKTRHKWQHIFNEQGGNVAVAIAVSWGGCNMFTDRGNAPGLLQIAFESARATV